MFLWDQRDVHGAFVPPGEYWWEVIVWEPFYAAQRVDWFCLTVQPPGAPALTEASPARIGTAATMALTAPTEPGALYIAGFSFSSNQPVDVLGLPSCLSLPILIGGVRQGIGFLDGSGNAPDLAVDLPAMPGLVGLGYHVQVLLSGASGLRLTNDLAQTILP